KKAAEARKKQKIVEVKEIKLRPMIDDHDYDVKMRSMQRFFEEGDKVKVTLRFRGREMAHQELGYQLLNRVKDDTSKVAKVEQEPRFEGGQVVMVLAPRCRCRRSGEDTLRRSPRVTVVFRGGLCHNAALPPPGRKGLPWRRRFSTLKRANPAGRAKPAAAKESQMPKLKTKSGAKKRFKVTATGMVLYHQSPKPHAMI